jgi:hypothetical protein
MNSRYQIRLRGQLDPKLSVWFGEFVITHTPDGDTLLTGEIVDQAALHGVFIRCRDLGMTLISVNPLSRGENIMNWIHAEESLVISASAGELYAIVSDYQVGHPAIVPKQYFTSLNVEKGGKGAGTVIRGNFRVFGKDYPLHQLVSEPQPGRVILETDIDTGQYTTFTFEPLKGGQQTRVTIASEFPPAPGIVGFLQRWTLPPVARTVYRKELRQLEEYALSKRTVPSLA